MEASECYVRMHTCDGPTSVLQLYKYVIIQENYKYSFNFESCILVTCNLCTKTIRHAKWEVRSTMCLGI